MSDQRQYRRRPASTDMDDIIRRTNGVSLGASPRLQEHFNAISRASARQASRGHYASGGAIDGDSTPTDRDYEIARAVKAATGGSRPSAPADDVPRLRQKIAAYTSRGMEPPAELLAAVNRLSSPQEQRQDERWLAENTRAGLTSAADPFGVPSFLVGQVSREARDAWRETYSDHPVGAAAGGFATPLGMLAKPVDVIGRALRTARGPLAGGSAAYTALAPDDAESQTSTKSRPVTPATQAELMGDIERRASPSYNPLNDASADLATIEARIAKDVAELGRIGSTSLPGNAATANASRERMSAPITARIAEDQARARFLRNVLDGLSETNKPLREKSPLAGGAAVVAPTMAAYLLSRGAYGKMARGLEETVDAARAAERAGDSVGVIRASQVAADKSGRLGPMQLATGVGAALLPIEGQGIVDAIDYKSAPKWTRAYREAEETFKDPVSWLQKQAVPAAAGAAAALAGYKTAPLAPLADARSYARTADAFDPRGPMARSLLGRSAPEQIAPRYAMDVARASRGDELAARAAKSADGARVTAAEARGQAALAGGQADFDETVARALRAAESPTISISPLAVTSAYQTPAPRLLSSATDGSTQALPSSRLATDATQVSPAAVQASLPAPVATPPARSLPTAPATSPNPVLSIPRPRSLTQAQKDVIKHQLYNEASKRGSFDGITSNDLQLPTTWKKSADSINNYIDSIRTLAVQRGRGSSDIGGVIDDLRQLRSDNFKFAVPAAVATGAAAEWFDEPPSDQNAKIDRAMRAAAPREGRMDGGQIRHHSHNQRRHNTGRWRG